MNTELVFSRAAVREVDRLAASQFGVPSIVLMENAAIHGAAVAMGMCGRPNPPVAVVCGPGNNGGDGLAMARHLSNAGAVVTVLLSGAGDRLEGDAAINLAIVRAMGVPVVEPGGGGAAATLREVTTTRPDLLIDAVLGTGIVEPVRGTVRDLLEEINRAGSGGTPILAVDLPSGLDADTGLPLGTAVRADRTVTFVGRKRGFLNPASRAYTGTVVVAAIGAPRALVEKLGKRVPV